MNPIFREERMSDEFTKYHIDGLPFDAVLHKFTAPDIGGPHDHPFDFTTHIIKGGYIERIYLLKNGQVYITEVYRAEGEVIKNNAELIHEIIALPFGDCYTLILPQEWKREWGFWRFNKESIAFRQHDKNQFKTIVSYDTA